MSFYGGYTGVRVVDVVFETAEMCSRDTSYVYEVSESKRKSRNLSEKKRRDAFNSLVTELALLVTGVERRLDKSNVLKQTIAFLKKHNKIQEECANSEEVDQSIPAFLSANEYFHLLLDSLEAFLFVVDLASGGDSATICYVSENAARLGSAKILDDLRGKSLYDFLHPDYENLVREMFRSKAVDPTTGNCPLTEIAQVESSTGFLGFKCMIRIRGNALTDEEDRIKLEFSVTSRFKILDGSSAPVCICLARPLVEGLLTMDALLPSWGAFALPASFEFSSRVTAEWKFIQIDQCVSHVLGYLPMEMLGASWYDYCHPDDLDKLVQSHEQLKTKTDGVTSPYRFRTKSEKYIWICTRFYITYHEWNSKLEFIACTHAVTDGNAQAPIVNKADIGNGTLSCGTTTNYIISGVEKAVPTLERSADQCQQHQNGQVFRPQPGVRIEHTPIPNTNSISKPPPAKKSKGENGTNASINEEEPIQSFGDMNERMLWELLEKRQTNLQEKILQHQQELKRMQEQLLNAMPLLTSASPASSSSTNEMELVSPASSSLSPAGGPLLPGLLRSNNTVWQPQQLSSNHVYNNNIWNQKFF